MPKPNPNELYVKLGMFLAYQGDARALLRTATECERGAVQFKLFELARQTHDMSTGVLDSIEELRGQSTVGEPPP